MTNDPAQDLLDAKQSYDAARPAPSIKGGGLFGPGPEFHDHSPEFIANAALENGGIARGRILLRRFVTVSDPEAIREILVSKARHFARGWEHRDMGAILGMGLVALDGEAWRAQRHLLQPAFTAARTRRIAPASARSARSLVERWDTFAREGKPVRILAEAQTATLETICDALLSVDLRNAEGEAIARDFSKALRSALATVGDRHRSACPMPLFLPTRGNRRLREMGDQIDRFIEGHLRPRFEHAAPARDDIVQSMIDAIEAAAARSEAAHTPPPFGWPEALAETKTLFIAGFETTATLLAWALHHLSHHPKIAERWHAECDALASASAGAGSDAERDELHFEALDRLPFIRSVLDETLRLSPPFYAIPRVALRDVGVRGVRIRKGDDIFISVLGAHRNPAAWPDPMRFDPDRFAPGAHFDKHAYLPFGLGGHFCIGASIALAEATLLLAAIGARFRLVPLVPHDVPTLGRVTFVPEREIELRLERR